MKRLRPYPAYKPTGLAPAHRSLGEGGWLPEVPREWEMLRLGMICSQKSIVGQTEKQLLSVYLNKGVVPFSSVDEKRTNATSESLDKYQLVEPGDFVLNNQQAWRGSVGVSDYEGIVSPAYFVLSVSTRMRSRFANYLFRDNYMVSNYVISSKGIGSIQRNLDWRMAKDIRVPVPPPAEQEAIVAYLDEKTAKIDRLIELKEREIKLLNEKKQAVISKVVTRESGDAIAVKYLVQINNGSDPTTEGDTPVYGSGAESFKTCGEFKIGPTVLLGRKGATLHIPHYVEGKYWNVDTAFDVKPLTKELDLRFFYYCATCFDYRRFISQTTLPSMTKSDYGRMKIPRLSHPEQREIVAYLDAEGAKTDKAIAAVTRQIGLLKEYRTRLISDAVTGRIDLRKL